MVNLFLRKCEYDGMQKKEITDLRLLKMLLLWFSFRHNFKPQPIIVDLPFSNSSIFNKEIHKPDVISIDFGVFIPLFSLY